MAATFSNPRINALPCELMRGCSFAEDGVTISRMEDNHGTDTGTGNSASYGYTSDGNGYFVYDVVSQPGDYTVVIRFSTTTTPTGNDYLISNFASGEGFYIHLSSAGITANHSDGVASPSACVLPLSTLDYTDGTIHTITYIVNKTTGFHILYVDSETAKSQTTTATGATGASGSLYLASDGTNHFTGTIYKARVFDQVLVEAEHDLYHADTLTGFWNDPYAAYKCDSFGDDTGGNYIWDRTIDTLDITKGDGTTAATMPEFDTDKYHFDLIDDYVTLPTLPTTYTISAAVSTKYEQFPEINQTTGTTFTALIEAAAGYHGYIHNLAIFSKSLSQIELYHAEYMQLYWLWRGRAYGMYHRLITEGTCKFAQFMDGERGIFTNIAPLMDAGAAHSVTRGDPVADGCTFGSVDSRIEFPYNSEYAVEDELTIVVQGDFDTSAAACTILDKGVNYKFATNGNQIDFNGSTIAHTFANNEQIGVTVKSGFKPRFYVDGDYIGEGTTTETVTYDVIVDGDMEASGVGDWTVGNSATLTKETTSPYEGLQNLKIAYNAVSNPYARQDIFTVGNTYRVTGVAKSDGAALPRVSDGGLNNWTGSTSTSWQAFDINITAQFTQFRIYAMTTGAGYVEFDDIVVEEIQDLTIGNANEHNHKSRYALKQVYIGDKALSDREIRELYHSAQVIGATEMETGQRVAVPVETFAGAVDYDVDPGDNFQLIDVVMTWDVAPTTSESITIFSIRETVKITEESYDPSLSSDLQHVFRFDKRFDNGITYGVDYTNTDANSVKVYSTYQLDPSVT